MDREFDGVEWDRAKSDWNREHRGFAFDVAADVFSDDYIESKSCGQELGEQRFVAIGSVDGRIVTVVWTPRGTNRRIISARPASRKERKIYYGHRQKETL
jgi:uncharacterized DUF497 family protein